MNLNSSIHVLQKTKAASEQRLTSKMMTKVSRMARRWKYSGSNSPLSFLKPRYLQRVTTKDKSRNWRSWKCVFLFTNNNMKVPAGRVVVLVGVAVWWCSQGEVNVAAQGAVFGVAVVQARHKGRGERDEKRLQIRIGKSSDYFVCR